MSTRPKGEAYVWICGLGLAAGLSIIALTLAFIAWNGCGAFWPKPVTQFEVKPGSSPLKGGDGLRIAGEIIEENDKQYKIWTGNREIYGDSFFFVDKAAVQSVSRPPDLLLIERQSNPRNLALASKLKVGDEEVLASAPGFDARLDQVIANAAANRKQLDLIDNGDIATIVGKEKKLQVEIYRLEELKADTSAARKQLKELEKQREAIEPSREELKRKLDAERLHLVTADGRQVEIPCGDILSAVKPNTLGGASRFGLFLHRCYLFAFDKPRQANTEGGVFPALLGTFIMTMIMCLAVTPFGVIAALYLHEYARPGPHVRMIRIAINNLAGVPSIVYGAFGLAFFVIFLGGSIDELLFSDWKAATDESVFGKGGLIWASLTLAILTLPVVIVATEEALSAVPRGLREGALGCGASKWQAICSVVLPASIPGIITGMILAMARGAGEVAPLMLVGVVKSTQGMPIDGQAPFIHAERPFMHLAFHIYDVGFQSPDSIAARPMVFASAFLLLIVVACLNFAGIFIRNHLRRKYASGAF
ncbi:MAG: hypothetical protein RL095_1436 [Verrucomicrobiota bacterium]|jgi:phosphate transport system permease protein